jgi:hypothetical protein
VNFPIALQRLAAKEQKPLMDIYKALILAVEVPA